MHVFTIFFKSALLATLFNLISIDYVRAQSDLPSTEIFQSLLTTCAAGARIEIDGEIRGSFASVYDGARTSGNDFKLITISDFLSALPEEDRLDGYRLYSECVLKILRGDLSSGEEIPEVVELPSQILTSGEALVIKAVTLIASNTEIRAFPPGNRAASGVPGANGANGQMGLMDLEAREGMGNRVGTVLLEQMGPQQVRSSSKPTCLSGTCRSSIMAPRVELVAKAVPVVTAELVVRETAQRVGYSIVVEAQETAVPEATRGLVETVEKVEMAETVAP